ncbi:MAG: DUF5693 family protein [Candidatus Bipolaricaulia bacterium]
MERTRWALRVLVAIVLMALFAVSVARTSWELDHRQTTIAIHLDDLIQQRSHPESLVQRLAELREAGATAVTVSPLSVEAVRERFFPQRIPEVSISTDMLTAIRDQDLALYWRLDEWVPTDAYGDYLQTLMTHDPAGLIAARAVGVPSTGPQLLLEAIQGSDAWLGWAEFAALPAWSSESDIPNRNVFRAHLLKQAERARLTDAEALNRYVQAVRERRVRFVEVRSKTSQQAKQDVAKLRGRLTERGYTMGGSPDRVSEFRWTLSGLSPNIRDGLAWLLAVLGPLGAYGLMRRRLRNHSSIRVDMRNWLLASGASILGGFAAAAVLSDASHFLGLRDIPGVKPALAVPVAGASLMALSHVSWRSWRPVDVAVWVGVGAALLVALLRSGNFSIIPVPDLERELRNVLEQLLIVRPRFKEFLIGHPALLLWISLGAIRWRAWAVGLLALGMLGQASIVNSFLHLHTPLWVSLLRTFHGLWLGLLFGLPLIYAAQAFARRARSR